MYFARMLEFQSVLQFICTEISTIARISKECCISLVSFSRIPMHLYCNIQLLQLYRQVTNKFNAFTVRNNCHTSYTENIFSYNCHFDTEDNSTCISTLWIRTYVEQLWYIFIFCIPFLWNSNGNPFRSSKLFTGEICKQCLTLMNWFQCLYQSFGCLLIKAY